MSVKIATEASAKHFFSSARFAVVGASTNTAKFGHKIFSWYIAHELDVTPINPSSATVPVDGQDYPAIKTLSELKDPKNTSVSIITPPAVTLKAVKEAKELGVPAVWLQPGTFDEDVIKYVTEDGQFEAVVAGEGGRGSEGWCVLVDGEKALKDAGKL